MPHCASLCTVPHCVLSSDLQFQMLKEVLWEGPDPSNRVAPPNLVCAATQHNYISYAHDPDQSRAFHCFEMSPFYWGSKAAGFTRLDVTMPEESVELETGDFLHMQQKLTSPLTFGDAMALSGAATSATLGSQKEGSWVMAVCSSSLAAATRERQSNERDTDHLPSARSFKLSLCTVSAAFARASPFSNLLCPDAAPHQPAWRRMPPALTWLCLLLPCYRGVEIGAYNFCVI